MKPHRRSCRGQQRSLLRSAPQKNKRLNAEIAASPDISALLRGHINRMSTLSSALSVEWRFIGTEPRVCVPSLPQTQARAPGAERRGGVYGAASVTLTVSQRRIDFRHGGECEAQTGREAPAAAARDDQPARQPEMLRL